MLYNFFIYNRKGTCIYYQEWSVEKEEINLEEVKRNMYGLMFEMKRFIVKASPNGEATDYFSYTTDKYKLHCYETASGKRFVILTEPRVGSLKEQLQTIYRDIFVECITKNPLYKDKEDIQDCTLFTEELAKYLQSQSIWKFIVK
ncbi:Trafficking protein particle complex subunit [Balamuthia mandrillaris]